MKKSNIQLHTNKYSTKLTCCQVYNRQLDDLIRGIDKPLSIVYINNRFRLADTIII